MKPLTLSSISECLLLAGADYRVVDLGRGLRALDAQQFLEIENANITAPCPRQQCLWVALVFWNAQQKSDEYVWCLKLPLDEQGKVQLAARDEFLALMLTSLGNSFLSSSPTTSLAVPPDNPYLFTPSLHQRAMISAWYKRCCNRPSVPSVDKVLEYLKAPLSAEWQSLPLQAIAEVALRLNEQAVEHDVIMHFDDYASEFVISLFSMAEAAEVSRTLEAFLYDKALAVEERMQLALLRALSRHEGHPPLQCLLMKLLESNDTPSIETLSVIAARHWQQFDESLTTMFFVKAEQCEQTNTAYAGIYDGFYLDLVMLPKTRPIVQKLIKRKSR